MVTLPWGRYHGYVQGVIFCLRIGLLAHTCMCICKFIYDYIGSLVTIIKENTNTFLWKT